MTHSTNNEQYQQWAMHLQQLVDRTPALMGYWNAAGHNVVANAGYKKYFGVEPEEVRGIHYRDFLGEELQALIAPYIDGVLAGIEQSFERTMHTETGETLHLHTSYIPDIIDGSVVGFYALVTDITARVNAEIERDNAQLIFRTVMQNAPIGMAIARLDGEWLDVNKAFVDLVGFTLEELRGVSFSDLTHPDDRAEMEEQIAALSDGSAVHVSAEKRYIVKDGSAVWVQRNAVAVPADDGTDGIVIIQVQDITARKTAEEKLARDAITDALTGLSNRHFLVQQMKVMDARRTSEPFGVLFVDLDDFKRVNDKFGHAEGDTVLIEVARRLRSSVRRSDVLCRIGGDEFVVLAKNASSTSEINMLMERVRSAVNGTYKTANSEIALTASIGSSWSDTLDLDSLLKSADAQMYRNKSERGQD